MNNRKIGDLFERKVASRLDEASLVRGSGSWDWAKGDVLTDTYCIQCKYTDKPFYKLSLSDLVKAEKEASQEKKDFLFCIGFNGLDFILDRCCVIDKTRTIITTDNKSIKLYVNSLEKDKESYILFNYLNKKYLYRYRFFDLFLTELETTKEGFDK